jgi:molybdenum cofactor biosynthesis enzyme MoaA
MSILSTGHKLSLDIGTYCNLSCPSCFRVSQTKSYNEKHKTNLKNHPYLNTHHVTLDQVKSWFPKQFLMDYVHHVEFCGAISEPALNPFCIDLVKYFSQHVKIVSMSTNGDIKSVEWWKQLAKSASNFVVRFYPDSLKPNNSLYRQSNTENVIQNLKAFVSAGGKAVLSQVVFKHNQDEISEFKQLANQIGCNYKMFVAREFTDNKTTSYEATHNEKTYLLEKTDFIPSNPTFKEIKSSDPNTYCTLTYEKIIRVFSNGVIFPCCHVEGELFDIYEDFFLNESNTVPNTKVHPQIYKDIASKIEIQGGIKTLSLKYNSINDIMNSTFYRNALQTSWKLNSI